MKNTQKAEGLVGFKYSIALLQVSDAADSLMLRVNPKYNGFLNTTDGSLAKQKKYLEQNSYKEDDFYFKIVDNETGEMNGLVAIYDVVANEEAEWGRWIAINPLAALESVDLISIFAFERLHLKKIYSRTFAENKAVVSFHNRYGAQQTRTIVDYFFVRDKYYDAIEHVVSKDLWIKKRTYLKQLISGFGVET